MKYRGMTCATGSPAFAKLTANEDSFVAAQLRKAGAVCIGRTNTPPMMASGMHRGLYGRAESPYNLAYLTAAFSSGSSNGSASSTAASFAAFGLGSETVSSGRSPASNNGLVAYTPSRTVISPRGTWPLYPTCDVLVPHTRTVTDMLHILDVLTERDEKTDGDFWRQQKFVDVPAVQRPASHLDLVAGAESSLVGKRVAVPKMYIGGHDPQAKPVATSRQVIDLWERARGDLESLGATVVETDFPLVTNYEDDSVSGHANNVVGFTPDWNSKERGELVAYTWDDFLRENQDPHLPDLAHADGEKIFPRPPGLIPDRYMENKNVMNYPRLVELARHRNGKSIWEINGVADALPALEAQRKRDLEDWLDTHALDLIVFPANGDVGQADLDTNDASAQHALQNGVKYSNGNRAIRHMGVPTVSVCMGMLPASKMPVNLTFAGKHGKDCQLLRYAYAFEGQSGRRFAPPVTPELITDRIPLLAGAETSPASQSPKGDGEQLLGLQEVYAEKVSEHEVCVTAIVPGPDSLPLTSIECYVNGLIVRDADMSEQEQRRAHRFRTSIDRFDPPRPPYGGYGLSVGKIIIVIVAKSGAKAAGRLILLDQEAGVNERTYAATGT